MVPHLDFGVLSMLGNHLVSNKTELASNVYQSMLPITVTELGRGFVRGTYSAECVSWSCHLSD